MTVGLRTNLFALRTLRAFDQSSAQLNRTYERLATGARINRASDDAAGLSVSDSLSLRARVLNRGELNVSDGVSALSIADGSLESIGSLLTRMSELAEQAANGSFSRSQRASLDAEYRALDKEMRRIAATTKFNGLSLLSGDKSSRSATTLATNFTGSAYSQSDDGRYITFRSTGGDLVQLDTTTNTQTTLIAGIGATLITQSSGGGRVAFLSTSNINGLNPSGRNMVFLYDRTSNSTSAVTANAAAGEGVSHIAISADGSSVAFASTTLYSSNGSVSGTSATNYRAQVYNSESNTFSYTGVAVDTFTGYSYNTLSLSADGAYFGAIVFDAIGSQDETLYLSRTNSASSVKTRNLGNYGGVNSSTLGITNEGLAVFRAHGNLTGQNGSLYHQVFTFDHSTSTTRQITSNTSAQSIQGFSVSIDGTFANFRMNRNPTGENPGLYWQMFHLDIGSGEITQTTNYSANIINSGTYLSRDGTSLLYTSGANILRFDTSRADFSLGIETGSGTGGDSRITTAISDLQNALRGVGGFSLTSRTGGTDALSAVRTNIQNLAAARGTIGAALSRLGTASRLVSNEAVEVSQARSRIIDADVAEETAKLTRLQILQSASVALLAQANVQPQIALSLLDGRQPIPSR